MKTLRNKRGAALESAILFMMVVLMLGMLLTGVIMYTHLRVKLNDTLLTREIAIEQIGEDFVHDKADFEGLTTGTAEKTINVADIGTYTATVNYTDKDNKALTLSSARGSTLLNITVENGQITTWKYTK